MTGKQAGPGLSSDKRVWKNSKLTKLHTRTRAFDNLGRIIVEM